MGTVRFEVVAVAALVALTASVPANGATAGGKQSEQLRRGEYLATYGG